MGNIDSSLLVHWACTSVFHDETNKAKGSTTGTADDLWQSVRYPYIKNKGGDRERRGGRDTFSTSPQAHTTQAGRKSLYLLIGTKCLSFRGKVTFFFFIWQNLINFGFSHWEVRHCQEWVIANPTAGGHSHFLTRLECTFKDIIWLSCLVFTSSSFFSLRFLIVLWPGTFLVYSQIQNNHRRTVEWLYGLVKFITAHYSRWWCIYAKLGYAPSFIYILPFSPLCR